MKICPNPAHNVNRFDPFGITNHAVLAVGYGVDQVIQFIFESNL